MSDQEQERDPVVHSSLSLPLVVSALLLVVCLGWALYNEVYGERPWKSYQKRFVKAYAAYLKNIKPQEASSEKTVRASAEYQRLDREAQDAERAVAQQVGDIDREINQAITPQILTLNDAFQVLRSEIGALTYKVETSSSQGAKDSLRKRIEAVKRRVVKVDVPQASGDTKETSYTFDQLDGALKALRDRKGALQQRRVELLRPARAVAEQRDKYLSDRIPDVSYATLNGLQNKLKDFEIDIRQIYVKDVELVDRCESCHLGIREPVVLTKAAMGGEEAFVSHPDKELLKIHDPEKFGCTPCHGGNGIALTSVEKAHGRYEHWLWPLHYPENAEAGCQQCHAQEIVTAKAPVLNDGRETFRRRGCMGCHRYEGFDREPEQLQSVHREIEQLDQQKAENQRQIGFSIQKADRTPDNAEAQRLYQHADDLKVEISGINAQIEQLDIRAKSLLREVKKVGPDLKEVRLKLRKEWIPVWLEDPHRWRPGTKMPSFRVQPQEIRAISAFIWQAGLGGQIPPQPPGDPQKGKEAFETRGCMACHSMGEGSAREGGDFAANLTRVGEKDNYDYLVRWVHNPRERTYPYCPYEKRDLTAADYEKKGLPFVFDLDHSKCPNDGHELVVQQMTPMPSLRLSIEEARDIASYLATCKRPGAQYAPADFMDDPKMKAKGLALVRYYGCAGCHEIAGMEDEQRIGTELTREGSKPVEQLDFALLTSKAEQQDWHDHKGFFDHKLQNPAIYDTGKEKAPQDRLKMPNFNLDKTEIDAVSTFLLGSVDPTLPASYAYRPTDQRQDIVAGWWVVRKYNCMGCHQLMLDQRTVFMDLKRYQDPDWKDQRPPSLIGEGARVQPDWLMRFLANPSLSPSDTNRDGVRVYLKARMPTFYFSDGEIQKLVRFFAALSVQAQPYMAPKLDPLSGSEVMMARQLFQSEGAPCLKCHAIGDPAHDKFATAPNFLLAKERLKPGWTRRWMLDPAMMMPGTAMPSNLFKKEDGRWVFSGPVPASFHDYQGDHADLLVRYIFEFSPDELKRLGGAAPRVARQ
jgi:cytochrome c2